MRRIVLVFATLTAVSCSAQSTTPRTHDAPIVSTLRRAFPIPRAAVHSGIATLPSVASRALRVAADTNSVIRAEHGDTVAGRYSYWLSSPAFMAGCGFGLAGAGFGVGFWVSTADADNAPGDRGPPSFGSIRIG